MSVRCSRAAPPWSWSTGSSRSRSPRSSQRRQGAVAQELERARARLHVLAAVAGADLRETAAPLQIAPIVDGARCIEEDHTAAGLVPAHVSEHWNGGRGAETTDVPPRPTRLEVRLP